MSNDETEDEFSDETRELACIGFNAYSERADWKNYEGKPIPKWDELRSDIIEKWCVAVEAIVDALANEDDDEDNASEVGVDRDHDG